jgi:hypothetical protein
MTITSAPRTAACNTPTHSCDSVGEGVLRVIDPHDDDPLDLGLLGEDEFPDDEDLLDEDLLDEDDGT